MVAIDSRMRLSISSEENTIKRSKKSTHSKRLAKKSSRDSVLYVCNDKYTMNFHLSSASIHSILFHSIVFHRSFARRSYVRSVDVYNYFQHNRTNVIGFFFVDFERQPMEINNLRKSTICFYTPLDMCIWIDCDNKNYLTCGFNEKSMIAKKNCM